MQQRRPTHSLTQQTTTAGPPTRTRSQRPTCRPLSNQDIIAHTESISLFASHTTTAKAVRPATINVSPPATASDIHYDASTQEVAARKPPSLTALTSQSLFPVECSELRRRYVYITATLDRFHATLTLLPQVLDIRGRSRGTASTWSYH